MSLLLASAVVRSGRIRRAGGGGRTRRPFFRTAPPGVFAGDNAARALPRRCERVHGV